MHPSPSRPGTLPLGSEARVRFRVAVWVLGLALLTGLMAWMLRGQGADGEEIGPGPIARAPSARVTLGGGDRSDEIHLEPLRTGLGAASGDGPDVLPEPEDGLPFEPWRQERLGQLDRAWERIQQQIQAGAGVDMERMLMFMGLASRPVLDDLGLGVPTPKGVVRQDLLRPGHHYMSSGDQEYHVPHGLLPALDRYTEQMVQLNQRAEARRGQLAERMRAGGPFPGPTAEQRFVIDEPFLRELEAFHRRAQDAIAGRPDPY